MQGLHATKDVVDHGKATLATIRKSQINTKNQTFKDTEELWNQCGGARVTGRADSLPADLTVGDSSMEGKSSKLRVSKGCDRLPSSLRAEQTDHRVLMEKPEKVTSEDPGGTCAGKCQVSHSPALYL